jgi:glycosyltransferase involved in cell wall biosynthesis
MMAAMASLTIGVDVTPTINGATGIARYVRELGRALDGLPDAPVRRSFAVGRAQLPADAGVRHCRIPLRVLERSWARGGPPSVERLVGAVDTVHASGPALPSARAPIVAVVHDLAPIDHPDLHPARSVGQLRRYLAGLRRAAAVVVVSQATADRLDAEVPGLAIHVTPNGVTPLPAPEIPPLAGRPYVLAVGTPVPRKAFHRLVAALPDLGPEVGLVVVGAPGPTDTLLDELAAGHGVADRYHRVTAATDAELAGWYDAAAVVAVPSLEEGFSLPVVEAQRRGVPVVASDLPVHREVGGTAAAFVRGDDGGTWAEALREALLGGASVDGRVAAGRVNADRFDWRRAAAATLAVHRGVAG